MLNKINYWLPNVHTSKLIFKQLCGICLWLLNVLSTCNFYVSRPEQVVEERPIFQCRNCNMIERYDCFSDHVPFNRHFRTKIDYYLARDPFSPRNKRQFLILGSVCSVCDTDVCVKPECSLFYSKFFCIICARKNILNFPPCIQEKIKTVERI